MSRLRNAPILHFGSVVIAAEVPVTLSSWGARCAPKPTASGVFAILLRMIKSPGAMRF